MTVPPNLPVADEEHQWLDEYLRDRDVACPLCGYNLRGLVSGRCPECGRELRLRVGLAEPYLRAWLAAVISTGAGAGMGVFVAGVILHDGWPGARQWPLTLSLVYFLLCIPVAGGLLFWRREFLAHDRPTQSARAIVAVGLLVIALVGFFVGLER